MANANSVRLGLNVDHVATLRNARGGFHPDPVQAALVAIESGANGITAHLREDRRHIRDHDVHRLKTEIAAPLNLEMAATEEMVAIALKTLPEACCLVPERRSELTTEGGLNVAGGGKMLETAVGCLIEAGIRVSLFIDPDAAQIEAAARLRAPVVELHTGAYCEAWLSGDESAANRELERLSQGARLAASAGIEVHAGHGLDFDTAGHLAAIPEVQELNIGHFLIGEAIFLGLPEVILRMRQSMEAGRGAADLRRS